MKREDLRVGGVYKHRKYPLFIACTSLGERGSLEGMALNNYSDIYQGDMCRSWFIPSFEPFDISLSLEQGECKEAIKGGDLNHWRKVSEELPNDNIDVLVKIDIQGYIHYDVDRIIYGEWCNGDDGVIEWKPIN